MGQALENKILGFGRFKIYEAVFSMYSIFNSFFVGMIFGSPYVYDITNCPIIIIVLNNSVTPVFVAML